jgi:ubiquinone/menaquinone biosynthesis C-methylase UbiE
MDFSRWVGFFSINSKMMVVIVNTNKTILDATCGGRMMWFNKNHPQSVYMDRRIVDRGEISQQKNFHIAPDVVSDFTDMPFADESFHLVVFAPPHIQTESDGIMTIKYGKLDGNWRSDLLRGFNECMRVLKPNGTLIFKWGEASVSVREIIDIFGVEPLFGHTTAKSGKTKWITFMKINPTEATE